MTLEIREIKPHGGHIPCPATDAGQVGHLGIPQRWGWSTPNGVCLKSRFKSHSLNLFVVDGGINERAAIKRCFTGNLNSRLLDKTVSDC